MAQDFVMVLMKNNKRQFVHQLKNCNMEVQQHIQVSAATRGIKICGQRLHINPVTGLSKAMTPEILKHDWCNAVIPPPGCSLSSNCSQTYPCCGWELSSVFLHLA
jgi:hypothetical protein